MSFSRILPVLAAVATAGCDNTWTTFTGRVYDGASGARLTDYKLFLEYAGRIRRASVDRNGRYRVGELAPNHDFTIAITAEGYRSFLSHNPALPPNLDCHLPREGICPGETDNASRYFDAYVFPSNLPSPEVTFDITLGDTEALPSGVIRLQPTTRSTLYDEADEQVAGVGAQLWANDDDLQARAITRTFTDGAITFEQGELVYGVTYTVTVFGIEGYAPAEARYQSGIDGNTVITAFRVNNAPLALVFASPDLGLPVADGTIILAFNQPILFDVEDDADLYRQAVDDNFSIVSFDDDGDGNRNALPDRGDGSRTRGTDVAISGNQVILTWSGTLETTDADDAIRTVIYGGLNDLAIRSARGPATNRAVLGDLVGPSIAIDLVP